MALREPVEIRFTVADPAGVLAEIEAQAGDQLFTPSPNGSGRYALTYTPQSPGSVSLVVTVTDEDGATASAVLPIEVDYLPPARTDNLVYQLLSDLELLGDPYYEQRYLGLLTSGGDRIDVVETLLSEGPLVSLRQAYTISLLLWDRMPTDHDLTDRVFAHFLRGSEEILVGYGMLYILQSDPDLFLDDAGSLPAGPLGLIHVMLEYDPGFRTLWGKPEDLSTLQFFRALWRNRHGLEPTAQQTVQAASRIDQLRLARPDVYQAMDSVHYGRARFVEALANNETFLNGLTDVIYNPPNNHHVDDAESALLISLLWNGTGNESQFAVSRESVAFLRGLSQRRKIERLLGDLTFWNRFDYSWLNATRSETEADWRRSEWFGWFHYGDSSWPWVYHYEHGWIYARGDAVDGSGIWFWDRHLGWLWTRRGHYPWVYRHGGDADWYWHEPETREPRWFWRHATGDWASVPAG